MLGWMVMVGIASAADCGPDVLREAIGDAEGAFVAMEEGAFERALAEARAMLGCQEEPLTPVLCASVHRVVALEAFVAGDDDATILSLSAMLATQPGYEMSEDIAPPGSPLRSALDQARQFQTDEPFPLDPPASGWLTVDGRRAMAAPSGRPFVFQRIDDTGAAAQTAYVPLGQPLPRYETLQLTPSEPQARGGGTGMVIAGVATTLVGAGVYGAAFATRGAYQGAVEAGDEATIRATHRTTNILTLSGLGTVGLGGAFLLVGLF